MLRARPRYWHTLYATDLYPLFHIVHIVRTCYASLHHRPDKRAQGRQALLPSC